MFAGSHPLLPITINTDYNYRENAHPHTRTKVTPTDMTSTVKKRRADMPIH